MSKRERLEEALRQSEERFRLMVESVQDYGIFMLDPQGHIISWNRGAERIKGYSEQEILGQHFSVFYTPKDQERRFPDYELRTAALQGRFEDEGWRVRKDGTRFWANVVITALRDESGTLVGFGKVTRDLTERVQAEGERRALEREREARRVAEELAEQVRQQAGRLERQAGTLESLNRQLKQTNEDLLQQSREAQQARADAEAASRAKTEFLATMSHELRTPLNAIIGYTDLLEMGIAGPISGDQLAHLDRIRVSSQHLLMLIEDILDLSRIESGQIEIARAPARVSPSVEDALALLEPLASAQGLEIINRCREEGGDRFYVGDENRVRQILANLLSNAVKFTEPGGRIQIRCDVSASRPRRSQLQGPGPWVRIHVEDTGIGIPSDLLDIVFDPFVQVESGRTRTRGGTGLGLSISRQLARLMGGDLTLESELGTGSRFSLWLPPAPAGDRQGVAGELTGGPAGTGPRVDG